ncbi:BtrH N-terminal domain-containing protein [Clostridium grantii]|uniref:Butirosin biosynthesis protein H, N-terminal n=1 Tax=Clostridium grantii DSM 8605 TaxID=1121316 RepID=A0A1M5Y0K8_9CLOT|nr:BtrH N-terminal domain-containing protein [Clostridium grantii]SHI05587.1 Butirosin biosynthesis protein H, N-terminal [Clostridium grantii DSM 8605]
MILPVSREVEHCSIGDCKMVMFSKLLKHYGVEYTPAEIMVAASGLNFMVYKYKIGTRICFFISGRKFNLEEEFADKIGLKLQKRKYILGENKEKVKKTCLNEMIELLESGYPIFVMIDLFYLDYLTMKHFHMPFHAIIIIGYDKEKKKFKAIDSLMDEYVYISDSIMIKSMFETSVMKSVARAEYFYIRNEDVENLHKIDMKKGMNQLVKEYLEEGGVLDTLKGTINFIESIIEKSISFDNPNYINFIKYQIIMIYTEIRSQDYQHLFYRKLYFDECSKFFSNKDYSYDKKNAFNKLTEEDISLWRKLANERSNEEKFEMIQALELVKGLKKIYQIERDIINCMEIMLS